MSTANNNTMKIPSLPPLYFNDKVSDKSLQQEQEELSLVTLPAELQQLIADYSDWGTLARLSAVQKPWKNLMDDAANYGGHAAKWELAECLLAGKRGLERNASRAIRLMKELSGVVVHDDNVELVSERDAFAPAMQRLANCYLTGTGVDQADSAVGLLWLKAAHGLAKCAESAHTIALIYEYGEYEVKHDVFLAADWFRKAAELEHVEAMSEYAMCCELGCGRQQSDEEALEWYIKAAEAGHITAKFSVGEAFEEARGVPQSDEEACLWYYKAAVEGDEDSKKALNRLYDIARIVVPGVRIMLNA